MLKHKLFVVACRLIDVNLEKLGILKILKENNLRLEDLGVDLFNIFKNPITERIYIQCLLLELSHLAEHMSIDISQEEIAEEVMRLLINVDYRFKQIQIKNSNLRAIHLESPDTILFEYYERTHL